MPTLLACLRQNVIDYLKYEHVDFTGKFDSKTVENTVLLRLRYLKCLTLTFMRSITAHLVNFEKKTYLQSIICDEK